MFMKHFGMSISPFERDMPSDMLYDCKVFSEALARLIFCCQRRTMAIITGEVGAGKSTLLRMLRDRLDPNNYFFVYIADSISPLEIFIPCP